MGRFILILVSFFLIVKGAYAEIDPMLDLDAPPDISFQLKSPQEYTIKNGSSSELLNKKEKTLLQKATDKKDSWYAKLFKKKPKKRAEFDTVGGGYTGNIPDVRAEFEYKNKKNSKIQVDGTGADNYLPEEFQPSEIDDPLFLDVILNKEKPSKYTSDMFRIMKFLTEFRTVIETGQDIQKFNANVNLLDLHARRIENIYKNTPEGMSPSYWLLMDLAYKAKVLGNLKFDANYYSKFSPVTGTKYSRENINTEDLKLLRDLDKTIFAIKQLSN